MHACAALRLRAAAAAVALPLAVVHVAVLPPDVEHLPPFPSAAEHMVLVPGLDRLDGSLLDGMPDALWSEHSAELTATFEAAASAGAAAAEPPPSFARFCARHVSGADLRTKAADEWLRAAKPLAVVWDSDGTLVHSTDILCGGSNAILTARGLPPLPHEEITKGFWMPTATRLASLLSPPPEAADAEGLAAEFYTAATKLAEAGGAVECDGIGAVLSAVQGAGVKQAVVSNSLRAFVVACLKTTGAFPFFAVAAGSGGARVLEQLEGVLGEDTGERTRRPHDRAA
eukprot:SAG22_NODE_75_length_22256_cov_45.062960_8_plen_286_part_00